MTKADLLVWVRKVDPPLLGPGRPNTANPIVLTDYNKLNTVANATEARAELMKRSPPLTLKQVEEGMVEYNK